MLEAARPYCLRIQGPNCLGLMVPGLGLNADFSHEAPLVGDLAFLSQSGALITAIVDWMRGHHIGFSHVVSLGDMADADFGDLLDYLAGDAKSRAILNYMEAVTHARKFLSAARRAARAKPVIVVKAGREERAPGPPCPTPARSPAPMLPTKPHSGAQAYCACPSCRTSSAPPRSWRGIRDSPASG